MMERFAALLMSQFGPFQPRRLSAFVSAIGGLAADRLVVGGVVDDPMYGPAVRRKRFSSNWW